MSSTSPPLEAQRFGRSQTPESPRPVHIPEPANIPVLLNQMDPIFNDTATYNIPHNQTFSPYTEPLAGQVLHSASGDEHDPVQSFFREAENQATAKPLVTHDQSDVLASAYALNGAISSSELATSGENAVSETTELSENHNTEQTHQPDSENVSSVVGTSQPAQQSNGIVPVSSDHVSNPRSGEEVETGEEQKQSYDKETDGGVDYQSLLDNITQSTSTAPVAEGLTAAATAAPQTQEPVHSLPSIPGLPAKPPPQENPVEFPSFSYHEHAQDHEIQPASTNSIEQMQTQVNHENYPPSLTTLSNLHNSAQSFNEHASALNGLAQSAILYQAQSPFIPGQAIPGQSTVSVDLRRNQDPSERPWTPKTQSIYDHFLEDERRYVTEGIWDKFPNGSRLFVGNLPSEKVTKRDLFHTFHKYGQLAQISIKQAYGFVQFLEASSCRDALDSEQGVEIRGRKVHLEISKPQKNTRNAGASGGTGGNKAQARRRSRSPDRSARRSFSDFRDEPGRRRDEYRNRRSPSPRGYRNRSDFPPDPRDANVRSPMYGNSYGNPPVPAFDDEAALPLPRREPRSVPDVQLLILESEVKPNFINWVEQVFRAKSLQASTIWLNQRLPLPAVVKRQIIEGVQAVVKLTRAAQNSGKIPLQVFDRSGGATNVNFNEYVDLDPQIAADIVIQARAKERGPAQPFRPQTYPLAQPHQAYGHQNTYNQPQPPIPYPPPFPPQHQQQPPMPPQQYQYPIPQAGYRPSTQVPSASPNQPPNLQQLLANLRQPTGHQSPQTSNTTQNGQLNNANGLGGGSAAQLPHYGQSPVLQQHYGQYDANASRQGYGAAHQQPNVQNIMEQLARYQR